MSIRAAIKRHVRGGRLLPLEMTLKSDPVVRGLFYSPEVRSLLEGPWTSQKCGARVGLLRGDLESFVKGERVSVCLEPYRAKTAFLGRLDRPDDEVWDMRSRTESPGLRLFGRFAATDIFIAFNWAPRSVAWNGREPMGDRNDPSWDAAKVDCTKQWNTLFPKHEPVHGEEVQDYVTKRAIAV